MAKVLGSNSYLPGQQGHLISAYVRTPIMENWFAIYHFLFVCLSDFYGLTVVCLLKNSGCNLNTPLSALGGGIFKR
jgi:hypothetical protein